MVAIGVDHNPMFDPEQILQDPFETLDICSSLVTVNFASNLRYGDWIYGGSTTSQTVSLAHYSVKEYLINHIGLTAKTPNMEEKESQKILAMSCIAYLSQFDSIDRKRVGAAKLSKYCVQYWAIHSQKSGPNLLDEHIMSFLLSESFISFNRLYDVNAPWSIPHFKKPSTEMPTPLSVAVYFRLASVVKSMILSGIDVNHHRGPSHSALQMAAKVGDIELLDLLLVSGADVNAHGGDDYTALHAAAGRGHTKIVRQLLAHGADVNAMGGTWESVLRAAVHGGSIEIVDQVLAAGAKVNVRLQDGTVLHNAAMRGDGKVVQRLLTKGADPNAMHTQFGSVLATSAYFNRLSVVLALLNAGADVGAIGGDFDTALHAAAYRGHHHIVLQLLLAGAPVNAHSDHLGTALHAAVSSLSVDGSERDVTVMMLLRGGAYVNAVTNTGETPLHFAAHRGYSYTIALLIHRGADLNAEDHLGMTARQLAEVKCHREALRIFDGHSRLYG